MLTSQGAGSTYIHVAEKCLNCPKEILPSLPKLLMEGLGK